MNHRANATAKPSITANLEAERQLLGHLLSHNDAYWEIRSLLRPEHFYQPAHQDLYQNIGNFLDSDRNANPVTLKDAGPHEINDRPAHLYYLSLVKDAAHAVSVKDYANAIRDLAFRRDIEIITTVAAETTKTAKPLASPSQIANDVEQKLAETRFKFEIDQGNDRSISHVCKCGLIRMAEIMISEIPPYPSWGLKELDDRIGRLMPGCMYVLAGRPGQGKTAAGVCFARSIIRQKQSETHNFGVLYFTPEVTKEDLWARFVACEMAQSNTPVEYSKIRQGKLNKIELTQIEKYSDVLAKFPLAIDDTGGLTVMDIYVRAREEQQLMAKKGIKLSAVIVDYLQILKPTSRYFGNKVAEVSEISSGLLKMAKDLGIAVIAISQLSRKVEERNNKRPVLSDLRDSGQIEQDANSVIMLYRPAYYDNQNPKPEDSDKIKARQNNLEFIIAKARDGITGEVLTHAEIGRNHIREK